MDYILYKTEVNNIKDFINEIRNNFKTKDKIEYEKYEELLLIKAESEKPLIVYTEFEEPLKIKPYKKVLHSIILMYSNIKEENIFYRIKRRLINEEKRISLLSIKNIKELKEKIEELAEIKPVEYKEKKYKTFVFNCPKKIEDSFIKIFLEIEAKNITSIPFSTTLAEDNILETENKLFLGQIAEEDISTFISTLKEIGIDIEKIIFLDSYLFLNQK